VRKTIIIMAAVAIMAATGGYFFAMLLSPVPDANSGYPVQAGSQFAASEKTLAAGELEDLLGQTRPDFTLGDSSGIAFSAADFDGKVTLINFWATWCTPCVEEMPMLSRLYKSYAGRGVQIVGIALDDPQKAGEFAAHLNIDYPVLVGTTDAILVGRQFGNRAGMLPYSVLLDSEGIIRWAYLGALDRQELEAQIQALL
jgi:thiol-disulfide isomerase/thioredoxin